MTTKTILTKGTAAALALATAMTFAVTDTAEARYRRGNAAAGALFGLAAGAIVGGIIAHENERRWRKNYYYGGPRYYGYYGPRHCEVRWVRDGWGYRHRERVCW